MATIRLRAREARDDQAIVDLRNALNPDRPPIAVSRWREYESITPAAAEREIVVAELEGKVVGEAFSERVLFSDAVDAWRTGVFVDKPFQGLGAGRRLTEHLLERLSIANAAKAYAEVREDDPRALRFAEHFGFTPSGTVDRTSLLLVSEANLERCEGAYQRVTSEGIRVATLDELGADDSELLRRVYEVDVESSRDMPSSTPFTEMPYEEWARWLGTSMFKPERTWLAMDGENVAGLAVLDVRDEHTAFNGYTGVGRAYRGRGIARALKYATVKWCRDHGIESILTGNEQSNKPMLAINIDLGYQPLAGDVEVVRGF